MEQIKSNHADGDFQLGVQQGIYWHQSKVHGKIVELNKNKTKKNI